MFTSFSLHLAVLKSEIALPIKGNDFQTFWRPAFPIVYTGKLRGNDLVLGKEMNDGESSFQKKNLITTQQMGNFFWVKEKLKRPQWK